MMTLGKFLRPYKKLLVIGPTFKLLEAILELLLPFLMSKVIDIGVKNGDKNYIAAMGGLMVLIAVLGVVFALICQYSASLVSQGVGTDIRNALFKHIGTLGSAELDNLGTPSLINRITGDVNQLQLAVAMLIRLVIRAPFLCIGGLVMAFMLDAKLSIILVIVLPIFIIILSFIMKTTVPLYKIAQKNLDKIALILRENLSGVRVIRAFTRNDFEKGRFAVSNKEYESNAIKVGKVSALLNPLTSLVMNFSIGAIIWFGGVRVNLGSMTTGGVIAFIGYVTQILAALIVISNLVVIFTKAYASMVRVTEVFETSPSIVSPSSAKPMELGKESPFIIEFKDVSMSYKEGQNLSIKNISFQVKKGETIGIIGGTGSGKSTVIQLIPRFYDTARGQVLYNGVDIKDYQLEDLRSHIGIVPQKTVLFSGTILSNIKMGKEDATLEEVKEAAEIAMASEFIDRLPDEYGTKINRGGVNVSGGQRQRLTIARALVGGPEILILDDSFNALDYATDAKLRKALREKRKGMTTFIVSQRASTIKTSDKIIVLNEGEIAGMGTHEELIKNCQVYIEICKSQELTESEGAADEKISLT